MRDIPPEDNPCDTPDEARVKILESSNEFLRMQLDKERKQYHDLKATTQGMPAHFMRLLFAAMNATEWFGEGHLSGEHAFSEGDKVRRLIRDAVIAIPKELQQIAKEFALKTISKGLHPSDVTGPGKIYMRGEAVEQCKGKTIRSLEMQQSCSYGSKCVEIMAINFEDGTSISFADATDPVIGRFVDNLADGLGTDRTHL